MKIEINREAKTIKINTPVKLNDLIKELNEIFKSDEWQEYELICETIYQYIPTYPTWPTYPTFPVNPIVTY